ncbi:MAG: 50S ribosome-binding GTPase [Phycisphaerae bacterium]
MPADSPSSPATGDSSFTLLTSPGPSAVAVLRVRGPGAGWFLDRYVRARAAGGSPWTVGPIVPAELLDDDGRHIDDVLVTVHVAPPDWDVRLHTHGSPWVISRCREMLRAVGVEEAPAATEPLWPGFDLLDQEAHALLPRMVTLRGAHWLLQQVPRLRAALRALQAPGPLDRRQQTCRELAAGFEVAEWFSQPTPVVLVGPPNAGKSTLANALADQAVSLVSARPGTTRDWLDVPGQVRGFPVVWVDTAGLRPGAAGIEAEAARRTRDLLDQARSVVVVLDGTELAASETRAFLADLAGLVPTCVVLNKADLGGVDNVAVATLPPAWRERVTAVSALQGTGLDDLATALLAGLGRDEGRLEQPGAFTVRQRGLLEHAATADNLGLRDALARCLGNSPNSEPIDQT